MNNVNSIVEQAEKHCESHDARFTVKRKLVLTSLVQSEKALSAYDVIDYCKQEFNENIAAMSVYRILDFLENEKLVHKLMLVNKYVACSHITCGHKHAISQFLICKVCNRVEEMRINKAIMTEIKGDMKEAGFQLINPQVELTCICHRCVTKNA